MFATVNTFYLFLLCFCFVFHWICDVMDRADMYGRSVFCIMIQPFFLGCSPLVENEQTWLFHEQLNFKTKRYVSFILIEQPHNACKQKTMLIFKSLCLLCFQAETIHMLSSHCVWNHIQTTIQHLQTEKYAHFMYLWWSWCTLYLHAGQVRVTAGNSGLCCCTCVTYFAC